MEDVKNMHDPLLLLFEEYYYSIYIVRELYKLNFDRKSLGENKKSKKIWEILIHNATAL